ncbi:2-nitropropane dioxygenase [Aspergillus ambiguus]|uniref:NAD(P)H-dependent flavin oxidoreductase n=1 Tax=Aspergillus ambiguus TaxID=176160 RepID=UPI003CCCDA65
MALLQTPITKLLGIQHPIILAGMGHTAGADLVAAVSNAGGLGVIGGLGYTPQMLREIILEVKAKLNEPSLPFGVDLLLPQLGGSARRTNVDYTKGALNDLADVIIEEKVQLFVSAVGVPPKHLVDRLHAAGILYMNMVGHPKHVHKACQVGADLICAQGGEAGGHTGEIPTSVLIPACADVCRKYTSPLTGQAVQLVAAGGIFDGRGVAAALMMGANAVWVGTRFVTARESAAPEAGKKAILDAGFDSTMRSTLWTGRPLRARATPYIRDWEHRRRAEIEELQGKGLIVLDYELDRLAAAGKLTEEVEDQTTQRPMGCGAAMVNKPGQSANEIVLEMVTEAFALLRGAQEYVRQQHKL